MPLKHRRIYKGFTLAELLIALAILGVIATFTIPKVLQSQQDGKFKAIAKESAGFVSDAYHILQLKGNASASTTMGNLTQFLNYASVDTVTTVDYENGSITVSCSTQNCFRFHNGSIMHYFTSSFTGTATTNAIFFYLDPDGKTDGTTNGPGKSVLFWLYYNGKITSWGTAQPNTITQIGTYNPDPTADPPWFGWN